MRLRHLEEKDAPLMLEWMHDPDVVGKLKGNFLNKTLADAEAFIRASRTKLASSLLLAYHIKMQHPLLILSRLFFAVMAERHWRSHL